MNKNKKILIVEDDEEIALMYKSKFEIAGFEVYIEDDGLQVPLILESLNPSVLLLDIMMPKQDGIDTLQFIRDFTNFNGKIIILTNNDDIELKQKCFEMEISKYLIKSNITPSQLLQVVNEILEKW